MLSILIPTFNYNITNLVLELHQQVTKLRLDFEIIVLDDASTQRQKVEKNKKTLSNLKNASLIQSKKNNGRTYSRNKLAQTAKFENLLFLDADVLPEKSNFIKNLINYIDEYEIVFGGISYQQKKPKSKSILRWKYGKSRETRSVNERNKSPYLSVISGAIFIKKELFFKVNLNLFHQYGLDILFCENLKKQKAKIKHIDNPVIHLGLENNQKFLNKTKEAMLTLAELAKNKKIADDYRPIQKMSKKIKKYGVSKLFLSFVKILLAIIEKNLNSKSPSLFLFDIYRLYYYHINFKK